jgi:hypothetical protein
MTEDKDKLGRMLARKLQRPEGETCPSTEDIAALAEGSVHGAERDILLRHISACSDCYVVFSLTIEMAKFPAKKRAPIFHPVAMAASLLIIVISVFIIYKSGVGLKQNEAAMQMVDAVEEVAEQEAPAPLVMEKADKELMKTAPKKRAGKGAVAQEPEARQKAKTIERKKREEPAKDFSSQKMMEKKSRRRTMAEGAKIEYAGKIQSPTPPTPTTPSGRCVSLDIQSQFKNHLELERGKQTAIGGTVGADLSNEAKPQNLAGFLNKSTPGTPEHSFFQLAREGFFHNNKWHGGPASSKSLPKWKALLPRLDGIFREIALQTIRQLEKPANPAGEHSRG